MHTGREGEVDRETLASEILRYLERHPDAADTAQGVRIWWLVRVGAGAEQDEVGRALAELVATGKIAQVRIEPGIEIFRRGHVPTDGYGKERE